MRCSVATIERLRTIGLISTLVLGLLASPLPVEGQQAGEIHRIGYLSVRSREREKGYFPAFQQGLRKLGYVEGKNIVIEHRWAAGERERLPALAAELLLDKAELIVTGGGAAVRAAQRASKTIPIVMAEATAPVARGYVESLARPGGNTTGLSRRSPEEFGKLLELLKETVPNLSRVAVLWSPKGPASRFGWNAIQLPARQMGLQIHSMEVRSPNDLDKAFQDATRARAGAFAIMPGTGAWAGASNKRIADLVIKSRLPAISSSTGFPRAGGLMSYGTNMTDLYRRAATYVDKILKGAKPADLPVELPTNYKLRINLKTAKAIGLTIPPVMLMRADRVIQ
jgi:putative ABC transport system substrate-binding protein